jgi:hypothetical protein
MTDTAITDRIIAQGRALVHAIEALGEIEPTGWFEKALSHLLLTAYKRRLRGILDAVPEWVRVKVLDASSGDRSMVPWVDEDGF